MIQLSQPQFIQAKYGVGALAAQIIAASTPSTTTEAKHWVDRLDGKTAEEIGWMLDEAETQWEGKVKYETETYGFAEITFSDGSQLSVIVNRQVEDDPALVSEIG